MTLPCRKRCVLYYFGIALLYIFVLIVHDDAGGLSVCLLFKYFSFF